MRRKILCLLSVILMLVLSGCAMAVQQSKQPGEPFFVYFIPADYDAACGADAIRAETVYLEHIEELVAEQTAGVLMRRLIDGAEDETMRSAIPSGTELLKCTLEGDHMTVDMSSRYRTLSGVALTLADYCVTLTLSQLPEVNTVSVTVRGKELDYRDTQVFSAEDVMLSNTEDVVEMVEATLYFPDAHGVPTGETRQLYLYEGDTRAKVLLAELRKGPTVEQLGAAVQIDLLPQSVWVEDGYCYVNLPPEKTMEAGFKEPVRQTLELTARSLCSLKSIHAVQFLVDGAYEMNYGGVPIRQSYSPERMTQS